MVEREEFDALVHEMTKCKNNVHFEISQIKNSQQKLEEAMKGQSAERKTFNDEVKEMLNSMREMFNAHTADEMETIKQIHVTLKTVVSQTKENTSFISSAKYNEELEKRVAEKMNDINKPRQEMWDKVKYTAISVLTVAALGAIGSGVMVVFRMNSVLNGG